MEETKRRIDTFPSRKDGWLVLVLSVTAAIEVIAAVALITVGPASVWSGRILPFLSAAFIGALRGVKPTITVVGDEPAHA